MRLRHDRRKARREGALSRLEAQINSGTKSLPNGKRTPLTDEDRARIDRESVVLMKRIGTSY